MNVRQVRELSQNGIALEGEYDFSIGLVGSNAWGESGARGRTLTFAPEQSLAKCENVAVHQAAEEDKRSFHGSLTCLTASKSRRHGTEQGSRGTGTQTYEDKHPRLPQRLEFDELFFFLSGDVGKIPNLAHMPRAQRQKK